MDCSLQSIPINDMSSWNFMEPKMDIFSCDDPYSFYSSSLTPTSLSPSCSSVNSCSDQYLGMESETNFVARTSPYLDTSDTSSCSLFSSPTPSQTSNDAKTFHTPLKCDTALQNSSWNLMEPNMDIFPSDDPFSFYSSSLTPTSLSPSSSSINSCNEQYLDPETETNIFSHASPYLDTSEKLPCSLLPSPTPSETSSEPIRADNLRADENLFENFGQGFDLDTLGLADSNQVLLTVNPCSLSVDMQLLMNQIPSVDCFEELHKWALISNLFQTIKIPSKPSDWTTEHVKHFVTAVVECLPQGDVGLIDWRQWNIPGSVLLKMEGHTLFCMSNEYGIKVKLVLDDWCQAARIKETSAKANVKGRQIHLWEFIVTLLEQPEKYYNVVHWIDRSEKVFKVENTKKLAMLWGIQKKRPKMNYDKLSRSLRQYYPSKRNILRKTLKTHRLVYQFVAPYPFNGHIDQMQCEHSQMDC